MFQYIILIVIIYLSALYFTYKTDKHGYKISTHFNDGDNTIPVYIYIPTNFKLGYSSIIFAIHGADKNANEMLNACKVISEKYNTIIIAPKFDFKKYSKGGTNSTWTFNHATKLFNHFLSIFNTKHFILLGHSAGGQFVNRYIYKEYDFASKAKLIVAANSGTYSFPRDDWDWPYGIYPVDNKVFELPFIIYLGTDDVNRNAILDKSYEADLQGKNRFERGENYYNYCLDYTEKRNISFHWELIIIDGIGHNPYKMLSNQTMLDIVNDYI